MSAGTWASAPGDRYPEHAHDFDKSLVVETGSITFVADGTPFELQSGDRLELPAGTAHAATVGPAGVRCRETHLRAGSLPALRVVPKPTAAGAA